MTSTRPYIGGQAVIEGVMMRSPSGISVAVRRPDGTLVVRETPLAAPSAGWRKWPFLRGVVTLVESMSLGYRALQFSAEQQEVGPEAGSVSPGSTSPGSPSLGRPLSSSAPEGSGERAFPGVEGNSRAMMLVSLVLAVAIFVALPQGLAAGLARILGWNLDVRDFAFHALTGGFKLLVVFGYVAFISRLPEIRRVFQYHGAEHKTIYAYEAGLPLTVENVRAQSTLHPRCGTTFLLVVVVLSILVGAVVTPFALPHAEGLSGQLQTFSLRVALLPAIAALGYEFQRASARHASRGPFRFVNYPGFLFQKLTTREPDDAQIEVAIAALQSAAWREHAGVRAANVETTETFGSLEAVLARFSVHPAE